MHASCWQQQPWSAHEDESIACNSHLAPTTSACAEIQCAAFAGRKQHRQQQQQPQPCAVARPVRLSAAAAVLVVGQLQRMGVQHGCAGGSDPPHTLRAVNDRLEVYRYVCCEMSGRVAFVSTLVSRAIACWMLACGLGGWEHVAYTAYGQTAGYKSRLVMNIALSQTWSTVRNNLITLSHPCVRTGERPPISQGEWLAARWLVHTPLPPSINTFHNRSSLSFSLLCVYNLCHSLSLPNLHRRAAAHNPGRVAG